MGELTDLGILLEQLVSSGGILNQLRAIEKRLDRHQQIQERIMSTLDDLKGLAASIATLETNVTAALGQDSQYKSTIEDLKAQLAAAASQHTADQEAVAAGQAADATADQQVQALQADVNALQAEVAQAVVGTTPPPDTTPTEPPPADSGTPADPGTPVTSDPGTPADPTPPVTEPTPGTVTPTDPTAAPVSAGSLSPDTLVAEVTPDVTPVALVDGATAVTAGTLDASTQVTPVTIS